QAGNRCDVNDGARPTLAHSRRYQLDQSKHTFQIDLDHLIELAFVKLETETVGDVGGRVVYQDIDASELARGRTDQGFHLLYLADMAGDRLYARADFTRHVIQGFLLASADHHLCALTRKHLRNRFADTPTGSSDDGHLVFEN